MGDEPEPRVEIGVRTDGVEPVTFVRDNGVGIDPYELGNVFALFNKLDEDARGAGVGLAVVHQTITVHHGRIWVESEGRGKGCTFCFTLPRER
jgi:signal transduction histidine kinase